MHLTFDKEKCMLNHCMLIFLSRDGKKLKDNSWLVNNDKNNIGDIGTQTNSYTQSVTENK